MAKKTAKSKPLFSLKELGNTYVDEGDRFIVSLIVSYDGKDAKTPREAVAAALFAKDSGGDESDGTRSATPDSENSDAENIDAVMSSSGATTEMATRGGGGGPTSSVLSYAATNGRQVRKRSREARDRGESGGGGPGGGEGSVRFRRARGLRARGEGASPSLPPVRKKTDPRSTRRRDVLFSSPPLFPLTRSLGSPPPFPSPPSAHPI